jgi:hypothetical protein
MHYNTTRNVRVAYGEGIAGVGMCQLLALLTFGLAELLRLDLLGLGLDLGIAVLSNGDKHANVSRTGQRTAHTTAD